MEEKKISIVVTGDLCTNHLFWNEENRYGSGQSWHQYPEVRSRVLPGGALFLADFVALSTGAQVLSPLLSGGRMPEQEKLLVSSVELGRFPERASEEGKRRVYRVGRYHGYSNPNGEASFLCPVTEDDGDADLVILDDENNGFHESVENWPQALKEEGRAPVVIYKTNKPSASNSLWQHLQEHHRKNTVAVINANDLRAAGVNISKGLSWENTALNFVWQIHNNPDISFLAQCSNLIVPFGLEGVIYYKNDGTPNSRLFFLTYEFEGGLTKEFQGGMFGLTSAFVAGLARSVAGGIQSGDGLGDSVADGIRSGMVAAQKYFSYGFGTDIADSDFPDRRVFSESEEDIIYREHIQDVSVRNSSNPNCRACWYIIKDKSSNNLAEIAYDIVVNGEKSALKYIPIARFGNMKIVDRTEIESYHSIQKLMTEYIQLKNAPRPLSIAVFGTPGSGKSFGVTEVASSIDPKLIQKISFNLSQLKGPADLAQAFHKIRDLSLSGKIPLVFFDEFDSALDGKLGWLKYFLAPMQDGVFQEGDSVHPIGKSIFVFAGGTSNTYAEFCMENISDENERMRLYKAFQDAKGPDFVSRLRGYVNILGPNQQDEKWDQLFVIRRAMLLRSLLERKVPHLIGHDGKAQIDSGILRAMLKIPRYKHESRSMEAILEMSMLINASKWEQAYLPSKEQLKLHVDEDEFTRLLMHEAFFSEKIGKMAKDLHQKHREMHDESELERFSYLKPWNQLSPLAKESVKNMVRYIPSALQKINYEIISVKDRPEEISFTQRELEILGAYVHRLWCLEKKEAGWMFGEMKDEGLHTHTCLVSWDDLPREMQYITTEEIKAWPAMLADANFRIERLKYLCYCEIMGSDPGNNI